MQLIGSRSGRRGPISTSIMGFAILVYIVGPLSMGIGANMLWKERIEQ